MLPRSQRLPRELFDQVFKKGGIYHSRFFSLSKTAGNEGKTRISAVVTNKIEKTAVGRNNLRRSIYRIISRLYPTLKDGLHILIFIKDSGKKADTKDLEDDLKQIFVKMGVLR